MTDFSSRNQTDTAGGDVVDGGDDAADVVDQLSARDSVDTPSIQQNADTIMLGVTKQEL